MEFSYEGIGQMAATFIAEEGVEAGMAVAVTDSCTVGLGTSGKPLAGVVLSVRNGMAAVQVGGMTQVTCSGTLPAVGRASLCVDGAGGVVTGTNGTSCMIAAVDDGESALFIKM